MEGKHLSSMKQEPSSNPGKPTRKPKSPTSKMEGQTWCSSMSEHHHSSLACYPRVDNVTDIVKEHAAEALTIMHKESSTTATGRERLKRHREEVSGKVMIPDTWGQENLLTDWIDYASFDNLLAPKGITSAREALTAEGRRACTCHRRLRVESSC